MAEAARDIHEPARRVPVIGDYDVVVAGGGIAGVAAAVAAARNGASVCLLERGFALGGLATLGNVVVWLPLCDGRGRQVIGGLPEELLLLSVADLRVDNAAARFIGPPACWRPGGDLAERCRHRYLAEFNPASYMLALEELALSCGVSLAYDTRVAAVRGQAKQLTHVIVESKSGRSALACRAVVDATGDADVCFLAGEPTESLASNVLAGWFYYLVGDGLHLCPLSRPYSPQALTDDVPGPFFRGDDAASVTAHTIGTHALMRERLAELRAQQPDADVQPVALPAVACLRMTRRLVASFSLGAAHVHQWFDDAVGLTGDWRQAGPVYAVPWRALCAVEHTNLLVAGRCLSADRTIWDATRAIPTCALTGAAAGTGAALAVRDTGGDVRNLHIGRLQDQLRQQGFRLDSALARPALP